MKEYDAVVIGSGPAGITASMYLARSGCSLCLCHEQLAAGGQILQTEAMENYPGFPMGIKGYELADLFDAHLAGLAVDRPAASVESVTGSAGHARFAPVAWIMRLRRLSFVLVRITNPLDWKTKTGCAATAYLIAPSATVIFFVIRPWR